MIGVIFHGIGTPERELEPGEAPYWISTDFFETILKKIASQSVAIRISFDDGNASDYDIAFPRLRDAGLSADIFPLTGRIGQKGSLSAHQIREMASAGMGIGSHGIAHTNWATLSASDLDKEVQGSRDALEDILGSRVTAAAIPFGGYNAKVLKALKKAGYSAAYSSDRGGMNPARFLRPRTSVRNDMTLTDVEDILANRMSALKRLRVALGTAKRQYL